jgi:hypothetical protein
LALHHEPFGIPFQHTALLHQFLYPFSPPLRQGQRALDFTVFLTLHKALTVTPPLP